MTQPDGPGGTPILFVSDERAWPPISGYRHRTRLILSTLAAIGPVTWVAAPRNRFDDGGPLEIPRELVGRIEGLLVPATARSPAATVARWFRSGLPWPLAAGDWSAADDVLGRLAATGFGLIWAMGLDALNAVERAGIEAPVVVVDADLESIKLHRQLRHGEPQSFLRTGVARIDVGRWRRLEQDAANRLAGFSVCSEDERRHLGQSAFVTPNAYPAASPVDGVTRRASVGPTLLFVGAMGYEPNRQGAEWFATHVLGLVRQRFPEAVFRVVGAGSPVGWSLQRIPGVDLVGPVSDVEPELRRAAAVVVPIHWGGGTRVKILEAIANRVPVVSTTIGAEGLELEDEQHLLLADTKQAFAAACARVLDDERKMADMVDRASGVFRRRYAEDVVSHRLERHMRDLLHRT